MACTAKKIRRIKSRAKKVLKSLIDPRKSVDMPNVIKNPMQSTVVLDSTKASMIRHSPQNTITSVARAVLNQIGIVSGWVVIFVSTLTP